MDARYSGFSSFVVPSVEQQVQWSLSQRAKEVLQNEDYTAAGKARELLKLFRLSEEAVESNDLYAWAGSPQTPKHASFFKKSGPDFEGRPLQSTMAIDIGHSHVDSLQYNEHRHLDGGLNDILFEIPEGILPGAGYMIQSTMWAPGGSRKSYFDEPVGSSQVPLDYNQDHTLSEALRAELEEFVRRKKFIKIDESDLTMERIPSDLAIEKLPATPAEARAYIDAKLVSDSEPVGASYGSRDPRFKPPSAPTKPSSHYDKKHLREMDELGGPVRKKALELYHLGKQLVENGVQDVPQGAVDQILEGLSKNEAATARHYFQKGRWEPSFRMSEDMSREGDIMESLVDFPWIFNTLLGTESVLGDQKTPYSHYVEAMQAITELKNDYNESGPTSFQHVKNIANELEAEIDAFYKKSVEEPMWSVEKNQGLSAAIAEAHVRLTAYKAAIEETKDTPFAQVGGIRSNNGKAALRFDPQNLDYKLG